MLPKLQPEGSCRRKKSEQGVRISTLSPALEHAGETGERGGERTEGRRWRGVQGCWRRVVLRCSWFGVEESKLASGEEEGKP